MGLEHPSVIDTRMGMARVLISLGRAEDAVDQYQRAVAIAEKAFGPDHPDVARRYRGGGLRRLSRR